MDSKAEDDLDQLRGPFQLRTSSVSIGAQFPEAEVRAALPAGYEPVPEVTGGFYLYDARSGWAIAPFSSAFCWIDVKGHDSTAGETARCFIGAWYSGRRARTFQATMCGWRSANPVRRRFLTAAF